MGARPKPKRGETDINIHLEGSGLELGFSLAESLPSRWGGARSEGMLIFDVVFFSPTGAPSAALCRDLPRGLQFSTSRSQARASLGTPEWSSPVAVIHNDRWRMGDRMITVDFDDDEAAIEQVVVQLATA